MENLSHRYNVQWAVKDVSFEIPSKGIYGLLGSNGAGKSTTMNIMSGVLKQTQGQVYINDINIADNPIEAKKQLGFLPQNPPLYLDTTVEEYLINCAHLRRIESKAIKNAVESVMEKCSILHFRKRLLRNLSGGYQQRVGIAQAILHQPAFIILDEPTNGLDPNQIIEIRKLIKEIAEDRAVLLSTHMLTEVQAICDYIYMIEHGKMVFSGKIEDFDSYLTPNTIFARLLEMPSVESLKQNLEGLEHVEEMGGPNYRLTFNNLNGATERIVISSVKNNWRLDEVRAEKNSMNDVFSALSKKEN
ncbi:ABC transporter ATP-binding protein [Flavivirga sp. 57AJ16]|uniref:ABC transporter ATP-binding protein n=1 Tax=Flavivirga sp. 57AJ16 TaxID=3025307 RepID=UPI00236648F3|nr:ABC transporter ATP-binding protein [Flavivirga sp. 57AJ16]MDD7885094.1 ABC transporter ATP-binding protein [Flavivirga sp. 57AJ16]